MPYQKIVFFAVLILLFIIGISLLQFYISIKPPKYVSDRTPADYSMEYEEIELITEDGIEISAWFIPAIDRTNKTVILGHGYPFEKGNILVIAPFLHEKFNLMLFDFRYFGKSSGKYTTLGYKEQKDIDAVIEYLDKKHQKIGVFGFSLSASTALMSENEEIKAIVADSPYASLSLMIRDVYSVFLFTLPFEFMTQIYAKLFLGINIDEKSPLKSISQKDTPILLIHGSKDSQINVKHSYLLKNHSKTAELWIVDNADHGQAYFTAGKEYEKRVLEFFEKHLN